jgi:hypothetical protein
MCASCCKQFCTACSVLIPLQALQAEGSWREAERHFCEAKEWKAAVAMYRQQSAWEDALRVAKVFGGLGAAKQVGTLQYAVWEAHCQIGIDSAVCRLCPTQLLTF